MKIVVSTGEISGDLHGAALISTIKELFPQTTFIGMGSAKMRAAGADVLFDMTPQGTIGLIEALPNIFKVYKLLTKMKKLLRKENFFQAEDGIRDWSVTGVQTCALPI